MDCRRKGRSHQSSPSMFSGLGVTRRCIVMELSRMPGLYRSVCVCVCVCVCVLARNASTSYCKNWRRLLEGYGNENRDQRGLGNKKQVDLVKQSY